MTEDARNTSAISPTKNGDWEGRPLAPAEVIKVRRMMQDWDRYQWGWRFIGKFLMYAGAVVGFMWAARDGIVRVLKAMWGPGQ